MAEPFPLNRRQAILVFHFADRIKAELLLASRLLGTLNQLQGLEREGGIRLFLDFLKGLEGEINLGQVQIGDPEMVRIRTVMTGLMGMVESNMLTDIQSHFTWMITIMATYAQRAMEYLVQEKLI
ncbi:MAG TPA: hypothetical protein VGA79_05650 [Desulfobaccales bacterium]